MKVISYLVKRIKRTIKTYFTCSEYKHCCSNCKNRDEGNFITVEESSFTRPFEEKKSFYCIKHNRYVNLNEFCHDYDRN